MPALHAEIKACTVCTDLPLGPRPVVQFSATSRLVIIGQAPGTRVHASGIPWEDDSGERLRAWTGIPNSVFHDPRAVAMVPMGFCYPGRRKGGDLPPRPECAPLWHARIFALLPPDRLTLLVGSYAQAHYLPRLPKRTMTETIRAFRTLEENVFPLPHPAWRSRLWQQRNPWFDEEVLPVLRAAIRARLRDFLPPSGQGG